MFFVDYGGNNKSVKKEMQHDFSVSVNNRLNYLWQLYENVIESIRTNGNKLPNGYERSFIKIVVEMTGFVNKSV